MSSLTLEGEKISKVTIMFHNFLVKMFPIKIGMDLRENRIYIKIVTLNGCKFDGNLSLKEPGKCS